MYLALQIATGIWLGGLYLAATVAAYFSIKNRIEYNRNIGRAWWRPLPSRAR